MVWEGILEQDGAEHIALHARTGTGKTSGFVIPACFTWPGSLVVLDVKGEAFNATAGHRASRLNQKVFRFDPTALDHRSHRWNPLDAVDWSSVGRYGDVMRQAHLLMPADPTSSSNAEKFWIPNARLALAAVTLLLAEMGDQPLNLGHIWEVFARGDCQQWLAKQIETQRNAGTPFSRPVAVGISNFLGGHDAVLPDNVKSTVTTTLHAFFNPEVATATAASDFDLRNIRREPTTIYVTIAPGNIDRLRELLALFFDQLVNLNTTVTPDQDPTLQYPILILLDEFARLGKLTSLASAAQFARGYGIRIAYVIQDAAALRGIYGFNGAKDILSNLGCEIMFGTSDLDVAEEFSKRLGDRTVNVDTTNQKEYWSTLHWRDQTRSTHPTRRPIMLPQEILQMPETEQIVLRAGMPPVKSERLRWYEDKELKQLVLPPPTIPELVINPGRDDETLAIRGVNRDNEEQKPRRGFRSS